MTTNDQDTCPWCTHGDVPLAGEDREINTVEARPDPEGGEITRCADCYAEYVANRTLLTQLESHVLALVTDGYDEETIGDIVGRSMRNVHQTVEDAVAKREAAERQRRTAEQTLATIDAMGAETLP